MKGRATEARLQRLEARTGLGYPTTIRQFVRNGASLKCADTGQEVDAETRAKIESASREDQSFIVLEIVRPPNRPPWTDK
jgi:hypothetical protein